MLNSDLRYIFELIRVHKEMNTVSEKKGDKPDYTQNEKYIDDIVL